MGHNCYLVGEKAFNCVVNETKGAVMSFQALQTLEKARN
jgi:hypothetical protein